MREWLPALVACLGVTVTTRTDDPAISPEMRRLADLFAGTWSITETSASGRTVHGEEVWRAEPGGMPLVEEYHSRTPTGGDDYEAASFWWDGSVSKYRGLFCATFVDEGCAGFDIAWSGKEVVMTGLYKQKGETFAWTEVFAFDTPSSFTQTLQIGSPGALKPGSTIRATRRE